MTDRVAPDMTPPPSAAERPALMDNRQKPERKIYLRCAPMIGRISEPVRDYDEGLGKLIDDMFVTMRYWHGIGLAAAQVGVWFRVAIIDVVTDVYSEKEPNVVIDKLRTTLEMVNPSIEHSEGKMLTSDACLSMPGLNFTVERARKVRVAYHDRTGELHHIEAEGFLAVVLQHEIDHLDGKFVVDLLSPIRRQLALTKWKQIFKNFDRDRGYANYVKTHKKRHH